MSTAVLGVGNGMRSDDGVGLAVIDRLQVRGVPSDVRLVRNNGDAAALMDAWTGASRVFIIDAVVSDDEAGTVHRIDGRRGLPRGWRSASSHLVSVAEAVDLALALHQLPTELTVFGITAATTFHGDRLSPAVDEAANQVVSLILAEVERADA